MEAVALDRSRILAFRFTRHGLSARRPRAELVDTVAPIGLRRTKGTLLSLGARVEGVDGEDLVQAVQEGRLVAVFGARGTVTIVPADDVAVFTVGVAPRDEQSLREAIPGAFLRRIEQAGITATDALHAVVEAVRAVLAAGPLPRGETAMAVTRALPTVLTPPCRGRCPDPHVEDSLFRLAGVNGVMCFDKDADVLVSLDGRLRADNGDPVAREDARTEFVRRYLRCYGPSKPDTLAEWAGIGRTDARRSLDALAHETVDVIVDGSKAGVMLGADAEHAGVRHSESVRFLPPFDAYLLDRDRTTLVPERAAQRIVWRSAGNPGVVVIGGEPRATWSTRRKGKETSLRIEPLGPSFPLDPADLRQEASIVAALLGEAGDIEVTVTPQAARGAAKT